MNKQDFLRYAQIIVKVGANVQKGQKVQISSNIEQAELTFQVMEECYKAGAKLVEIIWSSDRENRLNHEYAETEALAEVPEWQKAKAQLMQEEKPVRIMIYSGDPDALKGIPADKISYIRQAKAKALKPYRDAIDGRHQWLIVAASCPAWAKKVFPKLEESEAVEKLWQAIFKCVYMDTAENPVDRWQKRIQENRARAQWLTEQRFVSLHYQSANGTDFTVGLINGAKWTGAADTNHENGVMFVPNMPTEEVFTSPMRGVCEGKLVATKALSWSGQLMENFSITFENGRAVSCKAEKGEDILNKLISMDDGASMLGEVALVPKESPINQTGLMFFNTLFDENACCHFALGHGFGEVLNGYPNLTQEEMEKAGVNDSIIHVDFMVGSEDLSIIGTKADGTTVPVFANGTWAK